ncbi:DUF4080 domain-containing protein, partial [Spirochaetota bacterium]
YIITGPGEGGFRHLLLNNINLEEKVIAVKNPPFSGIPFPYDKDDFKGLKNRFIYYESSRGCAFKCTYCLSSRPDEVIENRAMGQVMEELESIMANFPAQSKGHSVTKGGFIKFIDRTFNLNKTHYRQIWEFIIKNYHNRGMEFHFEIHPELLDSKDFIILDKCPPDLFRFEVGIQSVNSGVLKEINRDSQWTNIEPKIRRLLDMKNIHIHVDMIVGLPLEGLAETEKSFNEIYGLRAHHFQMGFLKVLPGTKMSSCSEQYGMEYSKNAPYSVKRTKWLSAEEIERLEQVSRLIDMLYNTHRFFATLNALEEHFTGPFELYNSLANYIGDDTGNMNRSFEVNAKLIMRFIDSELSEKRDFLIDCLRWDYCKTTSLNKYPYFLKSPLLKEVKKHGYNFISSQLSEKGTSDEDTNVDRAELKKGIFYVACSEQFRINYMDNKNSAVFLPGKSIILFNTPGL